MFTIIIYSIVIRANFITGGRGVARSCYTLSDERGTHRPGRSAALAHSIIPPVERTKFIPFYFARFKKIFFFVFTTGAGGFIRF